MSVIGWYYLHVNGSLIFKVGLGTTKEDIMYSDLALAMWPIDPADRMLTWNCLVEALAGGADYKRVMELAGKWGCTNDDAHQYAKRVGFRLAYCVGTHREGWTASTTHPSDSERFRIGFGNTALGAMADLAMKLGYRNDKSGCNAFPLLLRRES